MMSTRKRVFILLCVFVIICLFLRLIFNASLLVEVSNLHTASDTPILIMVFYEALCPDSKYFITKQLLPVYKQAASLIQVKLIPYGKAKMSLKEDGSFRFDCQHGPNECEANMYHACALEIIKDDLTKLEVVACMIRDNRSPREIMHKCVKEYNVENLDLIQKCFDTSHARELLKANGDATNALRPPATFIPTITLDGSQRRQALILKSLQSEICTIAGKSKEAEKICKTQYTQNTF